MAETSESRKQKGIAKLKEMIARWREADGEFRSYVAWRTDSLKLLGAGNTSGLFAIAVFLTTGTRMGGVLIAAKVCLLLYAIGFAAFYLAYRILWHCVGHIEDALIAVRTGTQMTTNRVTTSIAKGIEQSEKAGVRVMVSSFCFVLASLVAVLGILLS